MIYLLDDLNPGCRRDGVATHFTPFVVPFEWDIAFWEMNRRDLEVILGLA